MTNAKTLRNLTNEVNNGFEDERLNMLRTYCDEFLYPAMLDCAKRGEYDYQSAIEPWQYGDMAYIMRQQGYKVTCIGATPIRTLFIISWHN